MTASELAFLALGLLLGIATGGAIVMTLRSRPPTHEIRVTMARDAVPRRASTLASDVLRGSMDGPAPGGPGDRRAVDRDGPDDRTTVRPDGLPVVASPILPWRGDPAWRPGSEPGVGPSLAPAGPALAIAGRPTSIAIQPEADPLLARLGLAVPAGSGSEPETAAGQLRSALILPGLLAGDHAAIQELIDAVAGTDDVSRRAWDTLVTRLVEAIRQRSIDLGLIDLPMGNAFWDTFTIDQCRQIVVALQSTGRRYDGRADWADGLAPGYRDLSRALAEIGIDPRRVRAWPNSHEIAELFRGARVATAEAIARFAPTLGADELQAFLAERNRGLDELWPVWDAVRLALGLAEGSAQALA